MAVLVAASGAALGSSVGLGWQAGWLAGSVLGRLIFPQKGLRGEGPRLGDLSVTSSALGAPIAIDYGTLRMVGNMICSSGIREQKEVSRTGGKGMLHAAARRPRDRGKLIERLHDGSF